MDKDQIIQIIPCTTPTWALYVQDDGPKPYLEASPVQAMGLTAEGEVKFLCGDSQGEVSDPTDSSNFRGFVYGRLPVGLRPFVSRVEDFLPKQPS